MIPMDIQSLSTAMSQSSVQQQASVSLLKSSIDMAKQSGADMVKLIASGSTGNNTIKPEGVGTKIDLFA